MKRFHYTLAAIALFAVTGCGIKAAIKDAKSQINEVRQIASSLKGKVIIRYGGLGSFWTYARDDEGNFEITMQEKRDEAIRGTVSGTYEVQPSGFNKLTVTAGTGRFANTQGVVAYGIEVPGTLFLLKAPDEDKLIYMPVMGQCPEGTIHTSGIITGSGSRDLVYNNGELTHGLITIDMQRGRGVADARVFGDNSGVANANDQAFNFSCDKDGVIKVKAGVRHDAGILSASGVGNVDDVLMVPTDKGVTLQDLAGTYAGIAWESPDTTGNRKLNAFNMRLAAGTLTGTVDTLSSVKGEGTPNDRPFALAVTDMPAGSIPGAFKYSIVGDVTDTTNGLGVMLAVRNLGGSGKTFLAGYGQSRGSAAPYFMFAISK